MKALSHPVRSLIFTWVVMTGLTCAWGATTYDTTVLEERSNVWTRIRGSAVLDAGMGLAFDNAGYVYAAGYTEGAFDGQTNAGLQDLCLTKYAADGTLAWTRIWGSTNDDFGGKTALDRSGNVYVAGATRGSFDGQTNAQLGTPDFCLSKYTAAGVREWTRI